MQFCSYCNSYFSEKILDHLPSEQHKKNVLKSRTIKSTFQNYKNYIEVFNGEVEGHVSEIYRRNVYCLKYAELVKLRDGNDYNKYGEITGVTQTETKM